ncbi:MAG TPA: hypothetical protein VF941_04980 [Clostridia bacterium]
MPISTASLNKYENARNINIVPKKVIHCFLIKSSIVLISIKFILYVYDDTPAGVMYVDGESNQKASGSHFILNSK